MKVYRINMNSLKVTTEDVPEKYVALGGRGLTSAIIAEELDPECHPLGPNNKLVFAPGLLSGTSAPSSGRLSVGGKSPLTGGIKESNAGGMAALKLAKLGIKAIIIEGMPEADKFYLIKINKDGVTLDDASEYVGKGNYEMNTLLRDKFGPKLAHITIGPAGEERMAMASIAVNDPENHPTRHAGRGGLGAVLGSKGVKAMVIDDAGAPGVEIKDMEKFRTAAKAFSKMLLDHPVCGQGLPTYGTAILVNILNEAGGLPTKNFRIGRFDGAEKISGEKMTELMNARGGNPTHGCHPGCVMRCSQIYHDKDGKYLTGGFEYETVWVFGSQCLIDDIDAIAKADRMCDDFGVDTIDAGAAISVAMEAGYIPWGDTDAMLNLMEEIGKGSPIGRIIGNGAAFTGKAFGVSRVPVVKNQAIPAYDPRAVKGVGITYATSTMGADHTSGYAVTANVLNVGGKVNPLIKDGQVDLSRNLQVATAAIDSTGLCLFVAFAVLDNPDALGKIVDMLNAQYGLTLTEADVVALGTSILKTERAFNEAAGFTKKDDRLPEFFKEELPPHNTKWDFTGEELDEVYGKL